MSNIRKVKSRKLNKNIISKFNNLETNIDDKSGDDFVKNKKIKMSFTSKEEQQIDYQMETDDNVSIALIMIILVFCFIIGISLGYMLYRIAINSSVMFIVRNFFNLQF